LRKISKKKIDELQLEINNLLYDNQSLNVFNQKLLIQYKILKFNI
jgi:hypothetical protein